MDWKMLGEAANIYKERAVEAGNYTHHLWGQLWYFSLSSPPKPKPSRSQRTSL
jgi:hypothetical protein